jgi:hypothetical protein
MEARERPLGKSISWRFAAAVESLPPEAAFHLSNYPELCAISGDLLLIEDRNRFG